MQLPTAQAGWRNIQNLSQQEVYTILIGHPVHSATCHCSLPYADRLAVVIHIARFRSDVRPDYYPADVQTAARRTLCLPLLLSTHSRPELDRYLPVRFSWRRRRDVVLWLWVSA